MIRYIPTMEMTIGELTKGLQKGLHMKHTLALGLWQNTS